MGQALHLRYRFIFQFIHIIYIVMPASRPASFALYTFVLYCWEDIVVDWRETEIVCSCLMNLVLEGKYWILLC